MRSDGERGKMDFPPVRPFLFVTRLSWLLLGPKASYLASSNWSIRSHMAGVGTRPNLTKA